MADNNNVEVNVYTETEKPVARIMLNGYNIQEGGVFGQSGAMRSFKVVNGDVTDFWSQQQLLTIRDESGNQSKIRIFALPAEEGGSGFVELL